MIADEACWERGCACHDSRDSRGVELVRKREWVGLTEERKLYLAKYWFSAEHDINRAMMLLNHYEEERNNAD